MAGQAISAGSTGRRRVLFGALDRDGWTWASIKAAIWFVIIVMMLGYLPDRAYFTWRDGRAGRLRLIRNQVYPQGYRGFESLPLR